MSATSARGKSRRGAASAARTRTRSRAGSAPRWRRIPLLLWKLLPLVLVLLVAVAAFALDPEAVLRLTWACIRGSFGARLQIAGSVILLSGVAATAWAFRPLSSAVSGRQKSAQPRARRATSGKTVPAASPPPDATNASKRGPAHRGAPQREAASDRATPRAESAPIAPRPSAQSPKRSGAASEGKPSRNKASRNFVQ